MKKLLTLFITLTIITNTSNAAFTEKEASTVSATEQKTAVEYFANLSRKEFEQLTGRHLNLGKRLMFKIAQNRAAHQLKRNEEKTKGFNGKGFALGLLGGIAGVALGFLLSSFFVALFFVFSGVILSYLVSDDKNFHRWAWKGLAAATILMALLYLILIIVAIINGDFS